MAAYFLDISIIVVCSALLAWAASRLHQPVILGYFLCGVLIGPWGLKLVPHADLLEVISHIGVTLLLFLAGLALHPERLAEFFRIALVVTLGICGSTCVLAFAFLYAWGYGASESLIGGLALMFSSTILVVKLMPTTTLHHRRMGGICIAVLIAEDIIAVILIMLMGSQGGDSVWRFVLLLLVKAVLLTALAVAGEQFVLRRMMRSSDKYEEVLVILCLGWCLGVAALSGWLGLSHEVGAFIAGVAMARGKIALVLFEKLKPLRDFFLMFFFFVLGADFDFFLLQAVWLPGIILGLLIVVLRPLFLRALFRLVKETPGFAKESALRLGQASEFALIIAAVAARAGKMGGAVSQLVQFTAILTMILSSYIVVFTCPTPLGTRSGLKQD